MKAPRISESERRLISRLFAQGRHINDVHRITGRSAETLRKIREGV